MLYFLLIVLICLLWVSARWRFRAEHQPNPELPVRDHLLLQTLPSRSVLLVLRSQPRGGIVRMAHRPGHPYGCFFHSFAISPSLSTSLNIGPSAGKGAELQLTLPSLKTPQLAGLVDFILVQVQVSVSPFERGTLADNAICISVFSSSPQHRLSSQAKAHSARARCTRAVTSSANSQPILISAYYFKASIGDIPESRSFLR